MTRALRSYVFGGGPVTASVRLLPIALLQGSLPLVRRTYEGNSLVSTHTWKASGRTGLITGNQHRRHA